MQKDRREGVDPQKCAYIRNKNPKQRGGPLKKNDFGIRKKVGEGRGNTVLLYL